MSWIDLHDGVLKKFLKNLFAPKKIENNFSKTRFLIFSLFGGFLLRILKFFSLRCLERQNPLLWVSFFEKTRNSLEDIEMIKFGL